MKTRCCQDVEHGGESLILELEKLFNKCLENEDGPEGSTNDLTIIIIGRKTGRI